MHCLQILLNCSPRSLLTLSSPPNLPFFSGLTAKRLFVTANWTVSGVFASLAKRIMAEEQEPATKRKCVRIGRFELCFSTFVYL